MKQPKMSNLKINKKATKAMRDKAKASKKAKITINFDVDVLNKVKKLAKDMGAPYQTLLNKILMEALETKRTREDRLDLLEKEVKALKKKVA